MLYLSNIRYYSFKSYIVFNAIFSRDDVMALKSLATNKDVIIVTKPDKGRRVVILEKNTYVAKINEIISDCTKFELISALLFATLGKLEIN